MNTSHNPSGALTVAVVAMSACSFSAVEPQDATINVDGQRDASNPDAAITDWWNTAWSQRRKITFNNAGRDEKLANFPVQLNLKDVTNQAFNGNDLRFIADNIELPYEIERKGTSTLPAIVWVQIPSIAANSTDTFIYMYYGNAAAPKGEQAALVWPPSEYLAVYHFGDVPLKDSVGSHPVTAGAGATVVPTGLGGSSAMRFDGSAGWVMLPDVASLHGNILTLTAWANPTTTMGQRSVVARSQGVLARNDYFVGYFDGGCKVQYTRSTSNQDVKWPCGAVAEYKQLALIFEGPLTFGLQNAEQLYRDRESVEIAQSARPIVIGADIEGPLGVPNANFFNGDIDEVRFERVRRYPTWLDAQVKMSKGQFAAIGPAQARP
jgi:hypothetical protein